MIVNSEPKTKSQSWEGCDLESLVQWARKHAAVREDRFAQWIQRTNYKTGEKYWRWDAAKQELLDEFLMGHFRGDCVIGLYLLDDTSAGRHVVWDIDAHDENADPELNWRYAKFLYERLRELDFEPILEDSNGAGGYHVWVFFGEDIAGDILYRFVRWIGRNCPEGIELECFPKQRTLDGRKLGNQVRLPGKHHKRDHWSRFWDGDANEWVEGQKAGEWLTKNTFPAILENIPDEALKWGEITEGEYQSQPILFGDGNRPGDAFEIVSTWEQILLPHGWQIHSQQGDVTYWTRPGKDVSEGQSATTGYCGDRLYVFSSSAYPFEAEKSYSKFAAHTLLNHNGNFKAAARQLGEQRRTAKHREMEALYEQACQVESENRQSSSVTTAPESRNGWGEVLPLEATQKSVPDFPIEIVREIVPEFYDICTEIAHHFQVPVDLPACLGLSILSMALPGRVQVEIEAGGRVEECMLWTLCALESGMAKSPVLRLMKSPCYEFERSFREGQKDQIIQANAERKRLQSRLKELQKADSDTFDEESALEWELSLPQPQQLSLFLSDATPEAIVQALSEQSGRIAILDDEATLLDIAGGKRYGQTNYDVLFAGWSGQPYTQNRATRANIHLDSVCITVGIAPQPIVIEQLMQDQFAVEKGFVPRFLISYPDNSILGQRRFIAEPIPESAIEGWKRLVMRQFRDAMKHEGMIHRLGEGWKLVREVHDRLEPSLAKGKLLYPMQSWVNKAKRGQLVRLAAVLHFASGNRDELIPVETTKAAVTIFDYFLEHAKKVYSLRESSPVLETAKRILQAIKLRKVAEFKPSHWKGVIHSMRKIDNSLLEDAYELLQEANIVRRQTVVTKQGKEVERFHVNPACLEER